MKNRMLNFINNRNAIHMYLAKYCGIYGETASSSPTPSEYYVDVRHV